MPNLGDIKEALEIGYKGTHKSIWHACIDCGKERWVKLSYNEPRNLRCNTCVAKIRNQRGENNPNWRGGRIGDKKGYILIRIYSDAPFFSMASSAGRGDCKYIREHRLIMAQSLGRCLEKHEIVHHLNGIKDDNRIENLSLTHAKAHPTKTFIKQLQKRIRELEQLHLSL